MDFFRLSRPHSRRRRARAAVSELQVGGGDRAFPADDQMERQAKNEPDRYAKVRARDRARVRAWIARQREAQALERELGIHDWDERTEPLYERLDAIETEICKTPARTPAGIAVKLRICAHYKGLSDPDDVDDWNDGMVLAALRDPDGARSLHSAGGAGAAAGSGRGGRRLGAGRPVAAVENRIL